MRQATDTKARISQRPPDRETAGGAAKAPAGLVVGPVPARAQLDQVTKW